MHQSDCHTAADYRDLRLIISILNMITDLERIGDHASDICKMMLEIEDIKIINSISRFSQMVEVAARMVRTSIDAYAYGDVEMAKDTQALEDEMDALFGEVIVSLKEEMKLNPNVIEECTNLIFISKYLERVGDHATNLCESIVYNITGWHGHLT